MSRHRQQILRVFAIGAAAMGFGAGIGIHLANAQINYPTTTCFDDRPCFTHPCPFTNPRGDQCLLTGGRTLDPATPSQAYQTTQGMCGTRYEKSGLFLCDTPAGPCGGLNYINCSNLVGGQQQS